MIAYQLLLSETDEQFVRFNEPSTGGQTHEKYSEVHG